MAWYEYPNMTDSKDLYEFTNYINRTGDGLVFPGFLLVIWFIAFIGVFNSGSVGSPRASRAWVFASFITSILSILSAIMGLLSPNWMYLPFIALAIGLLWLKSESKTIE